MHASIYFILGILKIYVFCFYYSCHDVVGRIFFVHMLGYLHHTLACIHMYMRNYVHTRLCEGNLIFIHTGLCEGNLIFMPHRCTWKFWML